MALDVSSYIMYYHLDVNRAQQKIDIFAVFFFECRRVKPARLGRCIDPFAFHPIRKFPVYTVLLGSGRYYGSSDFQLKP
jgi:hypothetical protein